MRDPSVMGKKLPLLLTLKDIHLLSRHSLYKQTLDQFRRQHRYLDTMRLRRHDVAQTFDTIIKNTTAKDFDLNSWARTSKNVMSKTIDQIVADSSNWNGQGLAQGSLVHSLNEICRHSLHVVLSLDLLLNDSFDRGNLVVKNLALSPFMQRISDDVASFAKEKYGVCPDIVVTGCIEMTAIPPYMEFVAVEILKNSIKAVIDRYSPLDIDDAPPIEIHLEKYAKGCGAACILFRDHGTGMREEEASKCFDAFYSRTAKEKTSMEPTYQYSRDFGASFSGTGIGLLKSKVYADFHDANITLQTEYGKGTTVLVHIDRTCS